MFQWNWENTNQWNSTSGKIQYKIYFKLLNENEIDGYSFEKYDECDKVFNIIRSALPQNNIYCKCWFCSLLILTLKIVINFIN